MPYIGQGLTEGRRRLHNFVATSNQTTFTATYDVGYIDVYQNGILLTSTDYTATNGTTVVLAVGASSTDEITIIAHQIFSVTDTVSAITGGTFGGNVDVTGNITTTGSLRGPSSFTIDPATHGDNTGTVVIAGDLTVNGTTTTINSTTLDIDDKNITLASGSANASVANGAGFTVDLGSDGTATINYDNTNDEWDFNKPIDVASITVNTLNGGATNFDIKQNTADGSDNKRTRIGGGGDVINTRGAFIELHGNEHTSTGKAIINAGNVTGGEISLRTGGSENVVIAKNGNVGIGTPSPDTKFHVYNSSGNTYAKLESNANNTRSALLPWAKKSDGSTLRGYIGVTGDANKMEIATSTNDSIHFYTNNNPTNNGIFLKASGDVGIGTTSPQVKLQVNDTGTAVPTSGYGTGFNVSRADGLIGMTMGYLTTNNTMYIQARNFTNTDSQPLLLNPNGGNVGIGTDDLDFPLVVNSSSGGNTVKLLGRSADNISSLAFSDAGNTATNYIQGNSSFIRARADGGFHFRKGGTPVTTDTGAFTVNGLNVGIGTDNPVHKFHINQPGNSPQMRISGNANWDFYSYNDTNFYVNNASGTVLGLLGNRDAYFGKNLSIGDSVLSTYHTSYPALDLGSSASVQGYTGNNGVWLQSNLFMNTNGHWTSKSDDYSAMLELYDGNFHFYNTASGTGTRTLLTPMVIKQNGNVGIGTGNPNKNLHVYGTNPTIQVQGDSNSYYPRIDMTGVNGGLHLGTYWGGNITSAGDFSIWTGGTGDGGTKQLQIQNSSGKLQTYGNTFHIHAGQGTLGHANEFQFLTTEVATGTSGNWYDVCYVSHSPNLRFHGMSVQDNNQVYYGGARYMGALMGTYGNVACYQEQKRVSAMNGGGVSDIDYRYLNSGASSGSYRLQVKLNFSSGSHRVYTCVYGNATAEISKDGY